MCAAVSALLQTLLLGLEKTVSAAPHYRHRKGDLHVDIAAERRGHLVDVLFETFALGLGEIAKQYPGYMSIEEKPALTRTKGTTARKKPKEVVPHDPER